MKKNLTIEEEHLISSDHALFGTYLIWKYGFEPKKLLPKSTYHSHKKSLLKHEVDISTYRPNIPYEFFASTKEQLEADQAIENRKSGIIMRKMGFFNTPTRDFMTKAELAQRDLEDLEPSETTDTKDNIAEIEYFDKSNSHPGE